MLSKKLWLPALVAFALVTPATVQAQEMGGGDEKKDEGEKKPDEPKKDEPKKDEPKADAKKSLGFDAPPAAWKESTKGGGRGFVKHVYKLDAVEGEDAAVTIGFAGKTDYDKEKDRWVSRFEDKDGKKLDKSALKEEPFEANGVKGKVAEVAGNFAPPPHHSKKDPKGGDGGDAKAPEKKWTKVINVYLEGPDGGWIVRLQGGEKTVDKNKDDFMKFVKSVKIVDKKEDDRPMKKGKKGDD